MWLFWGLLFLVSSEMFWFLICNFCDFIIILTVSNFQFTTMLHAVYLGQYFRFSALHWLHILLSLVSRFGIAVLFGVLYVYTGELFPTVIRSIVMGTVSVGARIGSIISPYLYDVVSNNLYLQLSYIKSLFMYQGCITTFPRSHSHCSNSMTVTLWNNYVTSPYAGMSEKLSSGRKNPKERNKHANNKHSQLSIW